MQRACGAEVCLLLNQQKHSILIYKKTIILIIIKLTLEELRSKAFFQNTIDTWIMFCEENGLEWYDVNGYRAFINHLNKNGAKMQKFPLCIKESGGMYERGRDKTKFLEELSKFSSDDASAYTIKLSDSMLEKIRLFQKYNNNNNRSSNSSMDV
jgi:hypothetical protein